MQGVKIFFKPTLPETNSKFAPENGWLEYDEIFLLGQKSLFSVALAISFRAYLYYSHTTPIRIPKDMGMVWE